MVYLHYMPKYNTSAFIISNCRKYYKSKLYYAGLDLYFSCTMVVTEPFLCPTCEGCVYKGQDESETQQQIF